MTPAEQQEAQRLIANAKATRLWVASVAPRLQPGPKTLEAMRQWVASLDGLIGDPTVGGAAAFIDRERAAYQAECVDLPPARPRRYSPKPRSRGISTSEILLSCAVDVR